MSSRDRAFADRSTAIAITRDFEYMSTVPDRVIHQPSLFIVGENDLVLKMFGGSADAAFERMAAIRPTFAVRT